MRILFVVHTSLPMLAGYTIRSSYILQNLRQLGCELGVVTSARQVGATSDTEVVEGITHWRTPALKRALPSPLDEIQAMWALKRRLERVVDEWKPDVIHANSPMLVGLPAWRVAASGGCPLVYEVRGLWEDASVDRGKFSADSYPYRAARALETAVLRGARAVVTICESLRDEIAPRAQKEVHVVGNGVDVDAFTPRPVNTESLARWGLQGKRVVGYIGSFQPYEGLDLLVRSWKDVVGRVPDAHLVVTGAGSLGEELKRMTETLGVEGSVTFTGRVPHDQVYDIYAMATVLVYPRISTRTTRSTTPLKPLEAMAMGKPIIVSDLPAMRELVRPGETGLSFHAGDSDDLARKMAELLTDPALAETLGQKARQQVIAERQWSNLVARYLPIYEGVRRA